MQVRTELNQVQQAMAFSDPQSDGVVASLRNGGDFAAARLAIKPLVPRRPNIRLDLLFAAGVVSS